MSAKGKAKPRQGQDLGLTDVSPANEVVEGRALVVEVEQALRRYVVFPTGGDLIVSLWAIMTHLVERLDLMPRLLFSSPTRGCGKTRALDALSYLCNRSVKFASISASSLFRVIQEARPTVFFDEIDQAGLNAEDAGEIRRLLNAGHSRATAYAIRTVGKDFQPRRFQVFAPIALAGIGRLPDTLESRSIRIGMKRRGPGERVSRMREKVLLKELAPIASRIARWAADHGNAVEAAEPKVPEWLEDRDAENAEPLLAIADELGMGVEARQAFHNLKPGVEAMEENAALMMLSDLRDALVDGEITSHAFRGKLLAMDERPWTTWRRGQEITHHGIGKLLASFGVTTRDVRSEAGRVLKAYVLDPVAEDAFRRYLPSPIENEALQALQPVPVTDEASLSEALQTASEELGGPHVADQGEAPKPHQPRPVAVVAVEAPLEKAASYGIVRAICGTCGHGMTRTGGAGPWTCRECAGPSEPPCPNCGGRMLRWGAELICSVCKRRSFSAVAHA